MQVNIPYIVVDRFEEAGLIRRGFHETGATLLTGADLQRARQDYNRFYDVAFVPLPDGRHKQFVRGAIFPKAYLLQEGYQPVEAEVSNTTELLDRLVESRRRIKGLLVCQEDKRVYIQSDPKKE